MRRAVLPPAFVAIAVVCGACRLVPTGAGLASGDPSGASAPLATRTASVAAASTMPEGTEAPPECGFPPGTPLEFAGRSTTAKLDVQEVVGDPMSDDPADIYITRDKFDQGELNGRLVCAVFVEPAGFVEITVHPQDGGRLVPPTPYPSATAPAHGVAEVDAIDAARAHVDGGSEWEVVTVEAGPLGQLMPDIVTNAYYDWAQDLSADRWVWRVFLIRGDEGIDVVIDYLDGEVLGTAEYIVN